MRRAAARHHQSHRIAFKTEGWLHADEDLSQLNSLDQQLTAKRIDTAGRSAPLVFYLIHVRALAAVLVHAHAISDVGSRGKAIGVARDYSFTQRIGRVR